LLRGQGNLVGIDDHDEVTPVNVRREGRLVLATQEDGGLAGQPSKDDVGGVDDVPLTLNLAGLWGVRTHG